MEDKISRQKLIEELEKVFKKFHYVWGEDGLLGKAVYDTIMNIPPAEQWITCSERLPGVADEYEVTVDYDGKLFTTNSFYSVCESEWSTWVNRITAWRERLPEPYKGE